MKAFLLSALCICMATQLFAQNDIVTTTPQDTTSNHDFQNDTIVQAVHIEDYIRHRGSGMIVAVKGNPEAKNKSTIEFLSVLPGVRGINIVGKADVAKVFVNGREMKLSPDELRRYLSGIRAEDVRQIQILPTHGAKYSADSRGGIIRIQLRSREEEQISGSAVVPLGLNTDNTSLSVSPSLSLNYLSKNLSSYTYASGNWLQDERRDESYSIGTGESLSQESSVTDRGFYNFTADQSLLWTVKDKHEIGFAVDGMAKPREWSTDKILGGNRIDQNIDLYRISGTLTYNWNYDDNGSTFGLTGDYQFTRNSFDQDYLYRQTQDEDGTDAVSDPIHELSNSVTDKHTWSVKADGDHFFGDDISDLSYGAFYLGMNARQDYNQFEIQDTYNFRERIYGAYVDFFTSLFDETIDFEAGIRYEGYHSVWSYLNPLSGRTDGKNTYNSFFPSASLSYMSDNGKSYTSLEYSRDTDRPVMAAYDPTVSRDADNVFSVSKSTLKPMIENDFSLTETLNNSHTFMLTYAWAKNLYDTYYAQYGDDIYSYDDNIGSYRKIELYVSSTFWIVKKWLRCRIDADGDYMKYFKTSEGDFGTWDAFLSGNLTLYLPKSWIIAASGNYMTPSVLPTEWCSGSVSLSAVIQKTFKDRYRLSLSASNIVSDRNIKTVSKVAGVNYTNLSRTYFRSVSLRFTYNFGSTKLNYVKRVRGNSEVRSRSSATK